MSALSNVVLVCLFGVVSSHVDNFLASPDVDIKAGFFPDSGYILSGQPQSPFPQDPTNLGGWKETPESMNNENKLVSLPETLALKPRKLQQIMSRMPEEKAAILDHKKFSLNSQAEDSVYLQLFTGTKESKGQN